MFPSMPSFWARVAQAVGVLLLLYGLLRLFEWKSLYFPRVNVECTPAVLGLAFEDITLVTEDGVQLSGWWVPHPQARGTIIHCHGNAGNLGHRVDLAADLHRLGLNVFLFDYRGYGRSHGWPSERGLYRDARAAYEFVRAQYGNAEQPPILVHGQSLGAAVAAQLAHDKPVRGLILESAFTSVPDMAQQLYPLLPLHLLCAARYDVRAKVHHLAVPKLIAHSAEDEMVPYAMSRQLFEAAAPPKRFVTLGGGHNDGTWSDEYRQVLREFVDQTLGAAPK
ncbi:MAG: alpha/beta hydrolase [Verrucomicrobia bacterium]|nr:MAG: alpha/beta hydrolase [Verrucomicrobiota bacterium]